MRNNKPQTKNHSQSGFTLIELSLVLIIVSLLILPLLAMYSNYVIGKKITDTNENIETATNYISTFFSATGRYPCPADPALAPTAANYGVESCVVVGSIVSTPGLRTPANTVLIGAVPITTIRNTLAAGGEGFFPSSSTMDGWDNRLTYAVTSSLTTTVTYKFYDGQVGAVDEFGNNTAGINNDGHFAIVSHGANGSGAFSSFGVATAACPAAGSRENENCDGDASFMASLGVYEAAGANYFDDISYFRKSSGASLWNFARDPLGNVTDHIYNLNTNNVGINTDTPASKLDVVGTLRATNNIKVERVCTADGSKCFNVKDISGTTGINCAGTSVMTGIKNGSTDCVAPTYSMPVNVDCTPAWITGVRTDGCVKCSDGSVKC